MSVLLSMDGLRADVEPMVGFALLLQVLAAEGCDALVATAPMPAGVQA